MNLPSGNSVLSVLGLVVAVWLIYLAIEVAKHVHAWPLA